MTTSNLTHSDSKKTVGAVVVVAAAVIAAVIAGARPTSAETPPLSMRFVPPAGAFDLLTPENSALVLIDHQPQMAFGVQSIDRQLLLNNTVGLAKSAKVFNIPTVLTSVAASSFSGPIWPELQAVFPDLKPIDRTSMNSWDDPRFRAAVEKTGRKKIVMAALWTEVCLSMPAIEMMRDGYEIYAVTDASGGTSTEAHAMALRRLEKAGAIPVTWQQVMLEWQRDWARSATYDAVTAVIKQHSGAYGMGVNYAKSMLGEHASEAGSR